MLYHPLSLKAHFNNDGISYKDNRTDGDFDDLGNTFPAEELLASNQFTELCEVSFLFPDKSDGLLNNIALEGQELSLSIGYYNRLALLGASDSGRYAGGGYVEPIRLCYQDGKMDLPMAATACCSSPRTAPTPLSISAISGLPISTLTLSR